MSHQTQPALISARLDPASASDAVAQAPATPAAAWAPSLQTIKRCSWAESDLLLLAYHNTEWGVPEYDKRALWEKLMLDGFHAGLSWSIILRKRDGFRKRS
jgi:hypothetical protein